MRFLLLAWLTTGAWAQYLVPRLLSISQVQSALTHEPLSANPASGFGKLVFQTGSAIYAPTPEWNYQSIGLSYGWDSLQAISILGHYSGFDKLSHFHGGIGYALRLFQRSITVAVRGRALHTNLQEYGRVSQVTADLGLLWQIGPALRFGGYGYNLLARGWGRLPGSSQFGLGVSYKPTTQSEALLELVQPSVGTLQVRTGFRYRPVSVLELRLGVGAPLLEVSGGFSLYHRTLGLDFGYLYNPRVGSWVGIGFSYSRL